MSVESVLVNLYFAASDFCKGVKDNFEASRIDSISQIVKLREELQDKEGQLQRKNKEAFKEYESYRRSIYDKETFEGTSRCHLACYIEKLRLECLVSHLDRSIKDSDKEKKDYRY